MWTWAAIATRPPRGRGQEELARFAKLEYGSSEVGWLLARSRRSRRRRLWARIRSWIVHLSAAETRGGRESSKRRAVESETSGEEPSMSPTIHFDDSNEVTLVDEFDAGESCTHSALEYLGSGGNISYRMCLICGSVLIAQGEREVMIATAGSRSSAGIEVE